MANRYATWILALIALIISIGAFGLLAFHIAIFVHHDVFGLSPRDYLVIGLGIMFGMILLLFIIFLIPSESKKWHQNGSLYQLSVVF